ncbi:hypothetical protein ABEL47_01650 [Escherichia coli]
MDITNIDDIKDAELFKQLVNTGALDRLILKVKGKLSESLFNTHPKEIKQREDKYFTYVALSEINSEIKSFANDYETFKLKVGK